MNKSYCFSMLIVCLCGALSIAILPLINKKRAPGTINYFEIWNPAEISFLEKSRRQPIYSGEHIPAIETGNLSELGKLTALSFIYWIKDHPEGVISLPTGKTPELFIKHLKRYKENWTDPAVSEELASYGIQWDQFPPTDRLKFVQLDEFYPMDPHHKNSFTTYIKTHYLSLLEIPPKNTLLMDICDRGILKEKGHAVLFPEGRVDTTLFKREPQNQKERLQKQALLEAQEFCKHVEKTIQDWGGIGFFLSGIGPDGHVGFNMQGAELESITRLVKLNYPSAAAAAGDLGGIEYSRDKTAMTLGLKTIKMDPEATWILMAAGEGKAEVVANAIQMPRDRQYPATAFHGLPGVRCYLTKGAASRLQARHIEDLQKKRWNQYTDGQVDEIVIELALIEGKRLVDLTQEDFLSHPKSAILMRKFHGNTRDLLNLVRNRLIAKIEHGLQIPSRSSILHTGPHHDDIELAYYPILKDLLKTNDNHFAYLTSGFNSVTNRYMLNTLERIPDHSLASYTPEIFHQDYAFVLRRYLNAADSNDVQSMGRTESIILYKKLCEVCELHELAGLKQKIKWLKEDYFPRQMAGQKDVPEVQMLKGAMRESESERMLLSAGVPLTHIHHLRSKFYNGDYFKRAPTVEGDAGPLVELYNTLKPKIITVAYDPEGIGPDTHYKVLQIVAQAIRLAKLDADLKIWGYRNVWDRFKYGEVTQMIPVKEEDIQGLSKSFLNCFSTQKTASFPSSHHDGPFCELAEMTQREQYAELKTLLGEAFFLQHPNPLVRSAAGFIFLKEMDKEAFLQSAEELRSGQEA